MRRDMAVVRIVVEAQRAQTRQMDHNLKTNADRRAQANNSNMARFLRKNKAAPASTDTKAMWEYEYHRNVTKLSFLMLAYLYTQDDDKISRKEERSVKKFLKQKSAYLETSDYRDITKFIDDLPNLSYVMKYINENEIKEKVFKSSVSTVKGLLKYDMRYMVILKDLETRFEIE